MPKIKSVRVIVTSLHNRYLSRRFKEYARRTPVADAACRHAHSFEKGLVHSGDRPGIGIKISKPLAATYPCKRVFLPTNRPEGGALFSW